MTDSFTYSCPCFNVRLHLSPKYNSNNIEEYRSKNIVEEPYLGWELELGLEGIHIQFTFFAKHNYDQSKWTTVDCLNCGTEQIYSVVNNQQNSTEHVIIHSNAVCLKDKEPRSVFKIKIDKSSGTVPMPSSIKECPEEYASAYKQIQSAMNNSIEQLQQESKARIENLVRKEEEKLQKSMAQAKLDNDALWERLIEVSKGEIISENSHPTQFAPEVDDTDTSHVSTSMKRLSFNLDEVSISGLRSVDLENNRLNHMDQEEDKDESEVDEEDMFNLDEELSGIEDKENIMISAENIDDSQNANTDTEKNDVLPSASLKSSIPEMDQRFSWIKKKKKTNKYLAFDFDIKSDLHNDTPEENDQPISLYATSMPITIQYPVLEEEDSNDEKATGNKTYNDDEANNQKKQYRSFANYDFSFSDRLLSEQFPDPQRKKSLPVIYPQLHSFKSASLGTQIRKTDKLEKNGNDE